MFYTLGLDPQAVHQLADMLADPPAVTQAGVPDLLSYAMSTHFEATFFLSN